MTKYNKNHIKDLIQWLSYNVKMNAIDEDLAQELIDKKDYNKMDRLRSQGDYYANK